LFLPNQDVSWNVTGTGLALRELAGLAWPIDLAASRRFFRSCKDADFAAHPAERRGQVRRQSQGIIFISDYV
jgi:hypothetical protein